MKTAKVLLFLVSLTYLNHSFADWKKVRSGPGEYWLSISSVGAMEFFLSGFFLDPQARLPMPQPRVYWTQDGGKLLKPIMGNLPVGLTSGIPTQIFFVDTWNGWVAMGNKVYGTNNRGSKWTGADMGKSVGAIYFLDNNTGFAGCEGGTIMRTEDGGKTWTPVETGSDVTIGCFVFISRQKGLAAGTKVVEETDPYGEEKKVTYERAQVLYTTDGGRTWNQGFSTSGIGVCPLFLLKDGKHGWLAAMRPDSQPGGRRSTAMLLKTTDGGLTFEDTNMDVRVGTFQMMFNIPLTASYFVSMYWDDELRGHLAGAVYVVSLSGSGGEQHIYRIGDFVTFDGGQTWKKPDFGTITFSGDIASLVSDGQVLGGELKSLFEGWLVGEQGIWRYEYSCKSHADCGFGYICSSNGVCEALPSLPQGDSASVADNAEGGSGVLADANVLEPWTDGFQQGNEGVVRPSDTGPISSGTSGGCMASHFSLGLPLLILFFALVFPLLRRKAWRQP